MGQQQSIQESYPSTKLFYLVLGGPTVSYRRVPEERGPLIFCADPPPLHAQDRDVVEQSRTVRTPVLVSGNEPACLRRCVDGKWEVRLAFDMDQTMQFFVKHLRVLQGAKVSCDQNGRGGVVLEPTLATADSDPFTLLDCKSPSPLLRSSQPTLRIPLRNEVGDNQVAVSTEGGRAEVHIKKLISREEGDVPCSSAEQLVVEVLSEVTADDEETHKLHRLICCLQAEKQGSSGALGDEQVLEVEMTETSQDDRVRLKQSRTLLHISSPKDIPSSDIDGVYELENIYQLGGDEGPRHETQIDRETSPMNEESDGEDECVICLTERRNTIVIPCRHLCLCATCAGMLRNGNKCPICRGTIEKMMSMNN